MTEGARRQGTVHLAERLWRQAHLLRASGVGKSTISKFVNGKTKPSMDLGHETPTFRDASDEELLTEFGHRMVQLQRDAELAHLAGAQADNVTEFALEPSLRGSRLKQLKRQRMLDDAQLVDRAASEGVQQSDHGEDEGSK